MATVRNWYRYMGVSQHAASVIRQDWEKRFGSLPPNGNLQDLPIDEQLKWMDLPQQTRVRATPGDANIDDISCTLENPPVNPITGPGRTAADVQRELLGHQEAVRGGADSLSNTAIFQADFVLAQMPGEQPTLQRVANGLCIDDATAADVSFTTAVYAATPETQAHGLAGDLVHAPNPYYDANRKKSGTKFLRHQNVTRDVVKVYHVQVTTVKLQGQTGDQKAMTVVGVKPEYLRQLAAVCPDYSVPAGPARTENDESGAAELGPAPPGGGGERRADRHSRGRGHGRGRGRGRASASASGRGRGSASGRGSERGRGCGRGRGQASASEESDDEEESPDEENSEEESSEKEEGGEGEGEEGEGEGEGEGGNEEGGGESSGDEVEDEDDSKDTPPVIPAGWCAGPPWEPGERLTDLLAWTSLDDEARQWHHLRVIRRLKEGRADNFTHDVIVVGRRGTRGISLTAEGHAKGSWLAIKPIPTAPSTYRARKLTNKNAPPHELASMIKRKSTASNSEAGRCKRSRRNAVAFHCSECSAHGFPFLYVQRNSPDGVVPTLKCSDCAPHTWVTISLTDYVRALA